MKILHVCLSGYFSEGWSYQDNLLVKAHVSMGHKVYILASQYYRDKLNINQTKKTKYKTIEGGIIYRLPYKISRFPLNINSIFRYYSYVKESLGEIHPDFIIVHGGQFLSILSIKNYIKNNKCKAVIDYHSDENNSAKNIFSKLFLHYFLWHFLLKYCNKYFNKIYCVTPSVEKFIIKYYHADEKKIELLPLGADYEEIDKINKYFIRGKIRDYLGISYDSIVFIHGGKIDKNKNTKKLLSAFSSVNSNNTNQNCYLVVFGDMKESIDWTKYGRNIIYVGWLKPGEIYQYYMASDVAVYPGGQSVLWQQAIACGLPLICKYWYGCEYLDLGGNVLFIDNESDCYLASLMKTLVSSRELRAKMTEISTNSARETFSYTEIGKKIIMDNLNENNS